MGLWPDREWNWSVHTSMRSLGGPIHRRRSAWPLWQDTERLTLDHFAHSAAAARQLAAPAAKVRSMRAGPELGSSSEHSADLVPLSLGLRTWASNPSAGTRSALPHCDPSRKAALDRRPDPASLPSSRN